MRHVTSGRKSATLHEQTGRGPSAVTDTWGKRNSRRRALTPQHAVRRTSYTDALVVENIGVVSAVLGERLMSQMAMFAEQVEELT
jgi:hypothetical protein